MTFEDWIDANPTIMKIEFLRTLWEAAQEESAKVCEARGVRLKEIADGQNSVILKMVSEECFLIGKLLRRTNGKAS